MKTILFDLDGTLTDSGEGIINCASLALEKLGLPVPDRETMRVFVGPPLRDSFLRFGVKPEDVETAIAIYRSRYVPTGMFENTPYPGIKALLAALCAAGHRLILATAKPESMATAIVEKFELAPYFELLCGASMDSSRDSKDKVIGYVLDKIGSCENVVMIGDTAYDVTGAAAHGIPTIGVSWGYGTVEDMRTAGAIAIADTTAQLLNMLL
ncbi:MAG: HAD family hydrolase [Ruminococcaceae bacterium]|nr:HAD family hydrolase [Oscillospiraceae bacterium]